MSATVMTRVLVSVEAGGGTGVAVVAGIGSGVTVSGSGVAVDSCSNSIPHSRLAWNRAVSSSTLLSSTQSIVAITNSAGPPRTAMMHTAASRSSWSMCSWWAAAVHSRSLRQAAIATDVGMYPPLSDFPVIISLGLMAKNAARRQSEDSGSSVPAFGRKNPKKICSRV